MILPSSSRVFVRLNPKSRISAMRGWEAAKFTYSMKNVPFSREKGLGIGVSEKIVLKMKVLNFVIENRRETQSSRLSLTSKNNSGR